MICDKGCKFLNLGDQDICLKYRTILPRNLNNEILRVDTCEEEIINEGKNITRDSN